MRARTNSCAPAWPSDWTTFIEMLADGIESADDLDLKMPSREAATVMLALGVGLGLMRSIDPSIPVNGLIDTLRLVAGQPI